MGNERADALAKMGSALRFKLMERQGPHGWFQKALAVYERSRVCSTTFGCVLG